MRFNLAVRNDYYYVDEEDSKCYVDACDDGLFAYCDCYKCKCLKNCKSAIYMDIMVYVKQVAAVPTPKVLI